MLKKLLSSLNYEDTKKVQPIIDLFSSSYVIYEDGNKWCATPPGFENLQESEASFGETPQEALHDLLKKMNKQVEVEITIPDEIFVLLSLEAHKRNITLNDLINDILRDYMNKN